MAAFVLSGALLAGCGDDEADTESTITTVNESEPASEFADQAAEEPATGETDEQRVEPSATDDSAMNGEVNTSISGANTNASASGADAAANDDQPIGGGSANAGANLDSPQSQSGGDVQNADQGEKGQDNQSGPEASSEDVPEENVN
jgi:hypothetical protein